MGHGVSNLQIQNRLDFCTQVRNSMIHVTYSHLSNKRGGWNKRGGGAKFAKSLNVEVGIIVEDGIIWKT